MDMVNKCKCHSCGERRVGCHGECESYIAFRNERDNLLDIRHENIVKKSEVDMYKLEGCYKAVRRNNNSVRAKTLKGKR